MLFHCLYKLNNEVHLAQKPVLFLQMRKLIALPPQKSMYNCALQAGPVIKY